MPIQVIMPQLGESVDEGTITKWLAQPGETVTELEPLLEVNTDKVDTEIPSPASGILLKIEAPEGTVAHAGMVIAWIGSPGETPEGGEPEAAPPAPAQAVPAAEVSAEPTPAFDLPGAPAGEPVHVTKPGRHPQVGFISPVVAKLAVEQQVDLTQIHGSGQGGRITKQDVLAYLETRTARLAAAPPVSKTAEAPTAAAQPTAKTPAPPPAGIPGELIPHTTIRRSIAEHMVMSKRTSPHVSTIMEVDLFNVTKHREANKGGFARDGVKLTFTAYFVAATVAALKAYPNVNSSWTDEGLLLHKEINIGMAASLGEAGLIVPVIKNADSLSLLGLARTVNDLAERARARKLLPDEVRGGTFTITNHGVSGSLFAMPIINQPQCGILGVGVIQKRVTVINDAIAIRPMAYISLTFDHRILDGGSADNFLGKVVETLQNWA